MVRVVLFGLLFAAVVLAGAAENVGKPEKADTTRAGKVAKAAKVAKPDTAGPTVKTGKAAKAEKPDTAAPAAKGAKAPPAASDPQSTYETLLREHERLERQKKILEWEEGLAAASLADSAAYLVIDLERQVITAKLGGVPMRDAPILSRYERPGQQPVEGIFLVAEKQTEAPPSLADSAKVALVGADSAKGDSAKIDTSLARIVGTHRGPAPRRYDPQKRYCITLQGGPDLWLAPPPSAETRMDSLELRVQLWLRDFPAVVQHRRSIHLFLAPADNHWIYAMAVLGARVLVIPPS
ncbi:MAG: hypothetical protein IT369_22290 [Candidatus Latescibacteria bacterium]|nr:hypothetical protein [Candidatus Latescibacterota bacterium]